MARNFVTRQKRLEYLSFIHGAFAINWHSPETEVPVSNSPAKFQTEIPTNARAKTKEGFEFDVA